MKGNKTIRGFTLVEILVVVSIIAILSGVILVALYSAKDEARDKVRISATEQLKLGIRLYKEAHGEYPSYPSGVEIGVGNSIDQELEPFLNEVKADPLSSGPNSEYGYWYYSNFNCNGEVRRVIAAKKMELEKNGNYDEVCSGGSALLPEEESLASKIIPVAYAGGGGGGGGGTPTTPCTVDSFSVSPTTVPQRGGTVRLTWNTSNVKDNGVTITPQPGSGMNRDDSRTVNVLQTTTFTLTGDGTSGRPDCTRTVTVTVPVYSQSTYQYGGPPGTYSQSSYSTPPYAQATYSWGTESDAVYVTLID